MPHCASTVSCEVTLKHSAEGTGRRGHFSLFVGLHSVTLHLKILDKGGTDEGFNGLNVILTAHTGSKHLAQSRCYGPGSSRPARPGQAASPPLLCRWVHDRQTGSPSHLLPSAACKPAIWLPAFLRLDFPLPPLTPPSPDLSTTGTQLRQVSRLTKALWFLRRFFLSDCNPP